MRSMPNPQGGGGLMYAINQRNKVQPLLLQKVFLRYTYITQGHWVEEPKLMEMWSAIGSCPLTTTLETLNDLTKEDDNELTEKEWLAEKARRRGLLRDFFKKCARVIVNIMFPGGVEGAEFANLKMSTMCPQTKKRMEVIECELIFC
jgi:hypothetical protein